MKKLTVVAMLLSTLGIVCLHSQAQDTTTIYKAWDNFLARIKKEKNPNAETILKLVESDPNIKAVRDQLISAVSQSLSVKETSEPWKEYTATYQHKTGDLNLLPLMEQAPSPIAILEAAAQADAQAPFNSYIEEIKSKDKQLAEQMAKNNKIQQVYKKEGEEGLEKRAMAESDKSAIIQQMGGMENLMKMTEAERKAAAMKMANELRANPNLILTNQNAEPAQASQQHDKLTAERNESKYVQDITLMNIRLQNRVGAATARYNKDIDGISAWQADVSNKIYAWYKSRYAAIPIVELGEYGHDKDPQQMLAMGAAMEVLRYYTLEAPEMQLRAESWKQYKTRCKLSIAELNDFVGNYKWGNNPSSNIFSPDADQQVASGISAAYGLMTQLAEEARNLTSTARGYQKRFEAQGK